ncbi:hypothetical protein, partial [uncultured Desulfovibrio sp.]|uniref:hypothetical protein n=1 Tax=uncultured Desulfovibrio sp. TaxID=167968 RepID=UPI0026191AFA
HTGFSRNATLVATVNPPALAGGVFNAEDVDARHLPVFALPAGYPREKNFFTISQKIRDIPDWCKPFFGLLVIPGAKSSSSDA